jgi:Aspartyl protease
MKKLGRLGFLAVLWLMSFFAFAHQGDEGKQKEERYGFFLKGKRQKYTKMPFEFHANLIVVKLRIDNSDTLRFILDTGVSSTIITDPKVSKIITQNFVRRVKISGAGDGKPISASVSIGHTIRIGDIIGSHQNIVFLDEDILKLSEYMGIAIHGIFGHDIFSNFVTTINFEDRTISLTIPEKFKYHKYHGERYPIVVTQSKPYTDAIAMVKNDKTIPMRLVIDTGAGHALLLDANENQTLCLPDKVVRANLGRGLNGDINGNIGRIGLIRMGHLEMKNIVASFPDSLSFSTKFAPTDEKRQGSIGCELLRRFVTTFNYHDGYIAMRPVRSRMKEAFEHDMSGLDIRARGDNFNRYFVDKIIPESPAGKAGLLEGDEVIFFNNSNVKDLTISDIYKDLSKREGKEISLFVRREGTLVFKSFRLKRLI